MSEDQLKLLAFDTEDLAVVSAHLQDAEVKVGDLVYLPRERRFALAADRFDWEGAALDHENRRRRTAVHFERVTAVRSKGVPLADKDARLNLLALAFEAAEAPSGAVMLLFEGGGCVCLDVECLEAALKDLGPSWKAVACPAHHIEDA